MEEKGASAEQPVVPVSEPVEVTASATQLEGPTSTEEAALFYLRKAQTHFGFVKEQSPSRPNSMVLTKLDEAEMWAERDIREKREAAEAGSEKAINAEASPAEQAA